jgi:tellurite resistance protein TehA-like permease
MKTSKDFWQNMAIAFIAGYAFATYNVGRATGLDFWPAVGVAVFITAVAVTAVVLFLKFAAWVRAKYDAKKDNR